MSKGKKVRILVVDDNDSIRDTVVLLLVAQGYEVSGAVDGFDALLAMKTEIPDVVISDLNMPNMSGFEFLSVVRRRFPQILVIAMSGAYQSGEAVPGGVIADAFYAKNVSDARDLFKIVAHLVRSSEAQTVAHTRQSAPVWVPRNGKDPRGVPYVVLTCTECLRSFPLNVPSDATGTVMVTECIFCLSEVRYIIDFSLSVASPKKKSAAEGGLVFITPGKTG